MTDAPRHEVTVVWEDGQLTVPGNDVRHAINYALVEAMNVKGLDIEATPFVLSVTPKQ